MDSMVIGFGIEVDVGMKVFVGRGVGGCVLVGMGGVLVGINCVGNGSAAGVDCPQAVRKMMKLKTTKIGFRIAYFAAASCSFNFSVARKYFRKRIE